MSLILNIDTAIDTAYVSIAKDGMVLQHVCNNDQKGHAAFLQPAIQALAKSTGLSLNKLDAIAVTGGPGSYTGLRVGMASAKGICYALNKPLIIIGTLDVLAYAVIRESSNKKIDAGTLYCPMIDARRMEVFMAVYDAAYNIVLPAATLLLNLQSFANVLLKNKIIFFGNGASKWQQICTDKQAIFYKPDINYLYMSALSHIKYDNNSFSDLAYSEPSYLKEFYDGKFNG